MLLERAGDIGGTWRDNTYPGCRCDVPSHLYSFSFAPNPNWSSTFSPQPEILDYLRDCAERFGILPHIRFDTEVESASWDDDEQRWRIETSQGPLTADVLDRGAGPADRALAARRSGHSTPSRAPPSTRPSGTTTTTSTGERVAVIGTGASAIQFVPEIQPEVEQLHVFQRTAPWVIPHRNRPMKRWERALYRLFPPAQHAMRAGIYWARESFVLQFRHRADRQAARAHPDGAHEQAGQGPGAAAEADAGLQHRLQAHPAVRRVVSGARAAQRRGGHRAGSRRCGRTRSSPRTAPSARSTRSSSAPAST